MLSGSRPLTMVRSFTSIALFSVVGGLATLVACSSDPAPAATTPAACVDAKCAVGNKCLALGAETKCRKTCTSNSDPATSCPFGYTCTDTLTGVEPFCVQDKALTADGTPIVKKASGQWLSLIHI